MIKSYIIKNKKPFCLFAKGSEQEEIGIASGYFAGNKFAETEGDEYITEISGHSFGWYDSNGEYYKNNKHSFTRPTNLQIHDALVNNPELVTIALKMKLIV